MPHIARVTTHPCRLDEQEKKEKKLLDGQSKLARRLKDVKAREKACEELEQMLHTR